MFCAVHTERIAVLQCEYCGIGVCEECKVILKGQYFCPRCAATANIPAHNVPSHKRDIFTAVLLAIFFPGMGQVYNGQVGKGICILLTCFLVLPYFFGIYDAYRTAVKINRGQVVTEPSILNIAGCLVMSFMMLAGPFIIWKTFTPQLKTYWQNYTKTGVVKNMQTVSQAAENYFKNKGEYPQQFSDLYLAQPPYITDLLCDVTLDGYNYSCHLYKEGYTIIAAPQEGSAGRTYTMTTGGILATQGEAP